MRPYSNDLRIRVVEAIERGDESWRQNAKRFVDDLTIVKTVNTDAINHDPAITFIQTGSQQPGRPSMALA